MLTSFRLRIGDFSSIPYTVDLSPVRSSELRSTTYPSSITFMSNTMKITSKGQVTIPIEIREKFGFQPNTEVEFQVRGGTVRLMKAGRTRTQQRGADIVKRLAGKGNLKLSTDQILALTRSYR